MPSEAEESSWRHLHPGSRVLLYEGDTVWHERMLLAATCEDQSEWMIVTPDSDVHYESFRTDVSRVIVLPDGRLRPPLNDPVYGFADAIGMEAARGLIADGLNEAIRRGVELGATPPEHSLLVTWDGQRVPLRTPLGPGTDARMDRTDDPREVHSGDATPRGLALDPSRAQDGAWHVTDFSKKIAHGVSIARLPGGSVLLEEWLRLQQEAASRSNGTAGPSAHDARVLAVETLCTGERSRTFASAVASMEQIEIDERLANTGSSDGPVADAFHPDVWERAAEQTHEVAIGDASTSGQRSSGRARDDFGGARAGERFRPAGRSQPEQFRMLVQAVPGDRGDVEAQRARGADRGNGTLHGQASSQRESGDEPRFVSVCGRPACVGDFGAHGAPQGEGGASGKTKAEGGKVMPELGKGTACIHTSTSQLGSLNGERGSHFRPPWRPVARDLLPLPLPEVLQISENAHSLSPPVRQRLLRRRAMHLRVAETVKALNFLDGHTWDLTCRPSQAPNAALEAIRRQVELSPPPLDGSSPEAALQELLGPLSPCSGEHVAQAAYEPDLVSLPEVAGGCDLASHHEGPDRDCLVSFEESLLLSEDAFTQRVAEEGLPTPHWDDALMGDVYIFFVNRLLQSGMLTLSLGCRSQAGIFFVRKKSGRLRRSLTEDRATSV